MKPFMDEDFLLTSDISKKLYNDYAKDMPIFDYHCHISPKEIFEDKPYSNITEAILYGDHYKWRFMRSMGISEDYCTGNKSDYEKWCAWAKAIAFAIGNPLYHWMHLELKRYFGTMETLSEATADQIWNKVNDIITKEKVSPRWFINKSNVSAICTTDDPADTLEYHIKLKEDKTLKTKVLPTYRPDMAVNIEKDTFAEYIDKLSQRYDIKINSYNDLLLVLSKSLDFFDEVGCVVSDHAVSNVPYVRASTLEVDGIFNKALNGDKLTDIEIDKYKTDLLLFFGREYKKRGWAMQIHMQALRNNNAKMFKKLGPDKGFDSIDDLQIAKTLSAYMNALEKENNLPKTILYTLNPKDNYVIGTMLGNFQGDNIKGKIQFGSGWWFNDQKDGMTEQIKALANLGALAAFVGMLTDSRSFMSYTRHEYFRRILCDILGNWVEKGEYPADYGVLESIVKGISFNNAKEYFGIEV